MEIRDESVLSTYLTAAVAGDRRQARAAIEQASSSGWTLEAIYMHLLVPAQVELGRLWQQRQLSVAEEHLATEITSEQMEPLRSAISVNPDPQRTVLLACVEGESHVLGARMFADMLMIDGWQVDFVGSSSPASELAQLVAKRKPLLVALSITIADHLPALRATIEKLRALAPEVPIIVGGAGIAALPEGDTSLGVAGIARDAVDGVQVARRAVKSLLSGAVDEQDYFRQLGERIHQQRSARGLTQQQLAAASELDRSYLSGVENGKQNPTMGALLRIARALDVPIDTLIVASAPPNTAAASRPRVASARLRAR